MVELFGFSVPFKGEKINGDLGPLDSEDPQVGGELDGVDILTLRSGRRWGLLMITSIIYASISAGDLKIFIHIDKKN